MSPAIATKRIWRLALLAAVPAAVISTSFLGSGSARAGAGSPAPDYSARLLGTEKSLSLADLRGDVVLLNTWATWCEPCKEEMPAFNRLYRRHRGDGLRVVAVSIDAGRADAKVSRYVKAADLSFTILRDPSNRIAKEFRVLGPPETFLIDRDGAIQHHWRGQMDPEEPANEDRILRALGLMDETQAAAAAAPAAVASAGLLVAFAAGLVSVLSPCVLPLVPSYASVIAGVSLRSARRVPVTSDGVDVIASGVDPPTPVGAARSSRGTAMWAGVSFIAGFSSVFIALGILVNRAGAALADNRVWLARGGGVILLVLGLHLLGVFRLRAADREVRFLKLSGRAGYAGVFLVGVAFAAAWSPCIGPVLAGILTLAASGGSTAQAALLLGMYCAGLAIPFLVAAFALDRFLRWSARLRRSWLPIAERVSGALVIAVGLLLLTGVISRLADWFS